MNVHMLVMPWMAFGRILLSLKRSAGHLRLVTVPHLSAGSAWLGNRCPCKLCCMGQQYTHSKRSLEGWRGY